VRDEHLSTGVSSLLLSSSAVPVSLTGTTAEVELARVRVPERLMGPSSALRVELVITETNNANNKITRVRLGGTGGLGGTVVAGFTDTTQQQRRASVCIHNRGAINAQFSSGSLSYTGGFTGSVSSAIDLSQPQDVVLTGQLANAGDLLTLEQWSVEILGLAGQ
jgi:hypothetical protein